MLRVSRKKLQMREKSDLDEVVIHCSWIIPNEPETRQTTLVRVNRYGQQGSRVCELLFGFSLVDIIKLQIQILHGVLGFWGQGGVRVGSG